MDDTWITIEYADVCVYVVLCLFSVYVAHFEMYGLCYILSLITMQATN